MSQRHPIGRKDRLYHRSYTLRQRFDRLPLPPFLILVPMIQFRPESPPVAPRLQRLGYSASSLLPVPPERVLLRLLLLAEHPAVRPEGPVAQLPSSRYLHPGLLARHSNRRDPIPNSL